MNILVFSDELSEQEKFLSTKLPDINIKFRNKFCVTGAKIDYSDLSKVRLNNITVTPKIFSKNSNDTELDYIGLYTIGVLEILYLGLCAPKEDDCHANVANFCSLFSDSVEDLFKSFDDVENIYNIINDLSNGDSKYNEAFNLYFMMRTNYDRTGRSPIIRYADWMMIIWVINPQLYWELFFDIMEFARLSILTLFSKFINPLANFDARQPWLHEDTDLKFGAIEYTILNTDKIKKITDCRGLAIHLVWSLYYGLIYNYGFDYEKNPGIYHNDDRILLEINKIINSCFGDDDQSKILKGKNSKQHAIFNTLDIFVYETTSNVTFTVNNKKFIKSNYEEALLFKNCYSLDTIPYGKNINMHYSNIFKVFAAIGELFYLSSTKLAISRESDYIKAINLLKDTNNKLTFEVEKQHNLVKTTEEQCKADINDEIESLKKQLKEAQSIIENKTKTISDLVEKNSELNKRIDDFYADEDNLEEDDEEISITTIEEMVSMLNDFKILMVGGRTELLGKLNEYGWVNVDQIDRNNISTGVDVAKYSDFCVINTRFISHTLAHKVESVTESERRMSFNGTNPEKLIISVYDFIKKYFEK